MYTPTFFQLSTTTVSFFHALLRICMRLWLCISQMYTPTFRQQSTFTVHSVLLCWFSYLHETLVVYFSKCIHPHVATVNKLLFIMSCFLVFVSARSFGCGFLKLYTPTLFATVLTQYHLCCQIDPDHQCLEQVLVRCWLCLA